MAKTITGLFPPHIAYVESYGGAANVLLAKAPSKIEVYNDYSDILVNFFRVLQDHGLRAALMDRLQWTPHAREEYALSATLLDDPDPVIRAWAFFTAQCQGISGGGSLGKRSTTDWGYSRTTNQASAFRGHVDKLPAIAQRLRDVAIEHDDGVSVIRRWDAPETLFYIDPPYADAARTNKAGRSAYHAEMDDSGQRDLVDTLLDIRGMAILSGYRTPLYEPLESAGWERREFEVDLSAAARTRTLNAVDDRGKERRKRTECLWLSPAVVDAERRKVHQCGLFPS